MSVKRARQNEKPAGRAAPEPSLPAGAEADNGFAVRKLQRNTLNDEVYGQLKQALIAGAIAPGSTMTIRSLATSFGISPMPVREALGRLVTERVLVMLPNRSVAVPVITRGRFAEITRIRVLLEGLAAEEGAARMLNAHIDRMAEVNEIMEGAAATGDYLVMNREFHFMLYAAAAMPTLSAMIESLWLQIGPLLRIHQQGFPGFDEPVLHHHRRALRALRKRDATAVREAIVADIEEAAQMIGATLPES